MAAFWAFGNRDAVMVAHLPSVCPAGAHGPAM
jgi:hypothetical protein